MYSICINDFLWCHCFVSHSMQAKESCKSLTSMVYWRGQTHKAWICSVSEMSNLPANMSNNAQYGPGTGCANYDFYANIFSIMLSSVRALQTLLSCVYTLNIWGKKKKKSRKSSKQTEGGTYQQQFLEGNICNSCIVGCTKWKCKGNKKDIFFWSTFSICAASSTFQAMIQECYDFQSLCSFSHLQWRHWECVDTSGTP